MPGSIPAPNPMVHSIIEKKENTGSQMGHTKKQNKNIYTKSACPNP